MKQPTSKEIARDELMADVKRQCMTLIREKRADNSWAIADLTGFATHTVAVALQILEAERQIHRNGTVSTRTGKTSPTYEACAESKRGRIVELTEFRHWAHDTVKPPAPSFGCSTLNWNA